MLHDQALFGCTGNFTKILHKTDPFHKKILEGVCFIKYFHVTSPFGCRSKFSIPRFNGVIGMWLCVYKYLII